MILGEAQKLVEALAEVDIKAEIRNDYSGRVMYGKSTVGVTIDSSYFLDTVLVTAKKIGIPALRADSLGRGSIVY